MIKKKFILPKKPQAKFRNIAIVHGAPNDNSVKFQEEDLEAIQEELEGEVYR